LAGSGGGAGLAAERIKLVFNDREAVGEFLEAVAGLDGADDQPEKKGGRDAQHQHNQEEPFRHIEPLEPGSGFRIGRSVRAGKRLRQAGNEAAGREVCIPKLVFRPHRGRLQQETILAVAEAGGLGAVSLTNNFGIHRAGRGLVNAGEGPAA